MEAGEYVGIVCGECDAYSPMGAPRCVNCGESLTAQAAGSGSFDRTTQAPEGAEEPMEQARNYVCKQCSSPVPSGHKFCGACGGEVPMAIQTGQVDFFGAMQTPGKARLVLIRGDQGVEGLSYVLEGTEHVAGREQDQILFPEDTWLSPRHANFLYENEQLIVRDENSSNGVFIRIREPHQLQPGETFLCGDQLFRLEETPADASGPGEDQTYFYSSPKRPSPFRLVQVLVGGVDGMVLCARDESATIGREEADLNFPEDIYMSGNHARVERRGSDYFLVDLESRNGTYAKVNQQTALGHGDYLFLGRQLLRVEMTA